MHVSQLAKASSKRFPQTILGPTKHGQTNDISLILIEIRLWEQHDDIKTPEVVPFDN